jgi:hypothetical protein
MRERLRVLVFAKRVGLLILIVRSPKVVAR